MTEDTTDLLVVTVGGDDEVYEEGLEAIRTLRRGGSIDRPTRITFPNEQLLAETFNARTYRLLNVIRTESPASIRETARLVDRDKKNVHEELTTLEALGAIRFEEEGRSRRPVFPYDDLVIRPVGGAADESTAPA